MATKKKMLQAAAGNAGGAALDITDVFSTYLYDGTNVAQTITNGIDLSGEGGLVWQKLRTHPTPPDGQDHYLRDTERGVGKRLRSNSTAAELNDGGITSVNSDGFELSSGTAGNLNGATYASWTFRKAPKFFDVVTWTGDGVNGRYIDHNLGVAPGFVVVKRTDSSSYWAATHKDAAPLSLNTNLADNNIASLQNGYVPSGGGGLFATNFRLFAYNGNMDAVNASGGTYVAYLFAHNDGDGEFGPDGDQDIIKCGSFVNNNTTEVDLGFEPQFVMAKSYDTVSNWEFIDTMRGMPNGSNDFSLRPNRADAEISSWNLLEPTATGFKFNSGIVTGNGGGIIYMAIRRGPLAQPESATEVFDLYYNSTSGKTNGVYGNIGPVDIIYSKRLNTAAGPYLFDRLRGGSQLISTPATNAESTRSPAWHQFDVMVGVQEDYATVYTPGSSNTGIDAFWKRAPGFCDVVAYTGDGVAGRTVSHNLGVAPEMMWVKGRSVASSWAVYHTALGNTRRMVLNTTASVSGSFPDYWNNTSPTETDYTVGVSSDSNSNGSTYIAYLFASLDGVSKVGSYTGNGSNQTIDCGFSSGARYVVIKRTDSTGDWYVWDTARGIVAGNDSHYRLNEDAAEVTTDDSLDPDSSGFIVNQVGATNINVSSASYIFYAIA